MSRTACEKCGNVKIPCGCKCVDCGKPGVYRKGRTKCLEHEVCDGCGSKMEGYKFRHAGGYRLYRIFGRVFCSFDCYRKIIPYDKRPTWCK